MRNILGFFVIACMPGSCISNVKQAKSITYKKSDKLLKESYLEITDNFHLNEYKANNSYTVDWISLENFKDEEDRPFEIAVNYAQLNFFKKNSLPTPKYTLGIFKSTQILAGKRVRNFELKKIIGPAGNTLQDSSICSLHKLPMQRAIAAIENGYDYPDRVDLAEKTFPNNGVIYTIDSSHDSTLTTVWICPKCNASSILWSKNGKTR